MTPTRTIDIRLVVLFAGILLPNAASAAITTVVESKIADAGLVANATPTCGAEEGHLVGGGTDTTDGDRLVVSATYPWLDTGEQWITAMLDIGATPGTFAGAALCETGGPSPSLAAQLVELPADSVVAANTSCQVGQSALSGGASATGIVDDRWPALLAPTWPGSPSGERLFERADGEQAAPSGWVVVEKSVSPDTPGLLTVFARCAPRTDLMTVVVPGTISANSVGTRSAFCPAGMSAVGGGVDSQSPDGLRLVASAPLLFGFPSVTRITDLPDGPTTAQPIGWRVGLRNDLPQAHAIKVAVVCAPEPGGCVLAAIATLTGLGVARRSALA